MSSILLRGSRWLHIWKTVRFPLRKPHFAKVAMGTFFQKEVIKYFSSSYIQVGFHIFHSSLPFFCVLTVFFCKFGVSNARENVCLLLSFFESVHIEIFLLLNKNFHYSEI